MRLLLAVVLFFSCKTPPEPDSGPEDTPEVVAETSRPSLFVLGTEERVFYSF